MSVLFITGAERGPRGVGRRLSAIAALGATVARA